MRAVRHLAQICIARVAPFHLAASAAAVCSLAAIACGGGGGATGPVPVASVEVALARSSMLEGETTNATATTKDANGSVLSGRPISWASSDPTVATVTQAGMVTALKAGATNVSASSEGRTGTATVTVTALPVATVSVSLASSLIVGATTQATSTVKDANGRVLTGRAVTWSSDLPSVATVNAIGFVSAVSPGLANITATSEGQSGSAPIMVMAPSIASITVTLGSSTLATGSRTQAMATAKDANGNILAGKVLTLSSDNPSVATVTPQGVVTGVTLGTTNITAVGEGVTGFTAISVAVSAGFGSAAEKIHIVDIGTTFAPTLGGPSASAATFVSRATSVATVDAQGTITGVGEGQGWVAVTAPGFAPDSMYVIVPRNSTGPLLRGDLTNFNVQAGTTIVVNVILDTRSTPIGGAELSVGYTTNPVVFQSISILGTGSPSPVITSVQQGVFRISLASGSPLSGQLSFLKFTFTAPITSGVELLSNRSGFLTFTLLDLVDPMAADLLPVSTSTRIPIIVK
jgi:uncharacterized protein YjdB